MLLSTCSTLMLKNVDLCERDDLPLQLATCNFVYPPHHVCLRQDLNMTKVALEEWSGEAMECQKSGGGEQILIKVLNDMRQSQGDVYRTLKLEAETLKFTAVPFLGGYWPRMLRWVSMDDFRGTCGEIFCDIKMKMRFETIAKPKMFHLKQEGRVKKNYNRKVCFFSPSWASKGNHKTGEKEQIIGNHNRRQVEHDSDMGKTKEIHEVRIGGR